MKVTTKNTKEILVYDDRVDRGIAGSAPRFVGTLYASQVRGKEVFSFSYDSKWLHSPFAQEFDPDLSLYEGPQYLQEGKCNFGMFLDSSPDRWGRVLMDRRESIQARMEKRAPRFLQESDYLLGVFDGQRMGALRFRESSDGPFLNDDITFATPPATSLRRLEAATRELEEDAFQDDKETLKWLQLLLAPGSSLGGARPKAGVKETDNSLWIAKFPSRNDRYDVGAWEAVTHELARRAGLRVTQATAKRFSGRHHTFLTQRFDRTVSGGRLHFASAMTLLGYTDGTDSHEGASYLELVEFLIRKGVRVNHELEELFRRIVFSICVHNSDDHLRNHGFLLTPSGWVLSPAYDINPNPYATGLKLNISEHDNSLDLDLARQVSPWFRVKKDRTEEIICQVKEAVATWREVAARYGLSRDEEERIGVCFAPDGLT
ncbi:MAG: HipA domain-containing protein [Tannerellaceae bacterium]|nr:HipA domain-containing protein [Tannerellaceae bacterium]